ncbi:hypothetical protein CP532_4703 [Ophiocordyceps camponoti-leonardi (nom. inval.)]|nr:hypothetical protein CP532_4703 [Ophiocordyceps camponoti-leonardi (nom. inval.)]
MSSPAIQEGLTTPDSLSSVSYEMGESSARASSRPPSEDAQSADSRTRRARHRSAGGFMLRDPAPAVDRHLPRRRFAHDAPHSSKSRAKKPTPRTVDATVRLNRGLAMSSDPAMRDSMTAPRHSRVQSSVESDYGTGPDVDTAQIVNMALSLSESRKLAARGNNNNNNNLARGTPPRLAPLPDGSSASNLRQHLQQQRRSSLTRSPVSASSASPRRASGVRFGSSRPSESDYGIDGQYSYHFSPSTLARAQKARETLELMTEYRRLLPALPPLKSLDAAPPRCSSPSRAAKRKAANANQPHGREYNPLQYIRNRKVRARERMVINGDRQGFGDVQDVRQWVDKVRQRSTILNADPEDEEDGPAMPPFPGPDGGADGQTSTQAAAAAASASSPAAARSRRPRVDWFVEPSDMIADAYWLEQDHHKFLIEDRKWRKILQPPADPIRPASSGSGYPGADTAQPLSLQSEGLTEPTTSAVAKVDMTGNGRGTRDRAKQKLQNMKTFPHRHNGSLHGHPHRRHHHNHNHNHNHSPRHPELKRPRRHSAGDVLVKHENGGTGHDHQTQTPTSSANDLLERQMMEMVANEAHELEMTEPPAVVDDDQVMGPPLAAAAVPRKSNSTTDSDRRGGDGGGRPTMDSPRRRRPVQWGADVPNATQPAPSLPLPQQASEADAAEQATTTTSSSTSGRHESPTRNPLSKFKHAIRDRNGDGGEDASHDGDRHPSGRKSTSSPERVGPSKRRPSSPAKLPAFERPSENSRTHKRSKSLRHRSDNPGVGLRGLFKGPRLDTVFRGGVFKLNDMLWRKDEPAAVAEPDSTTDESESERTRGRSKMLSPSKRSHDETRPGPRNFLEFMPEFSHAPGAQSRNNAGGDCGKETATSSPSRPSRPSSQIESLKPPLSGIWSEYRSASVSPSPFPLDVRRVRGSGGGGGGGGDSDLWDSESYQGSGGGEAVTDETSTDPPRHKPHHHHQHQQHQRHDQQHQQHGRHWSIADKSSSTGPPTRREIARVKALMLSSGIKALEINRRSLEVPAPGNTKWATDLLQRLGGGGGGKVNNGKTTTTMTLPPPCDLYPLASRTIRTAMLSSSRHWQASATRLTSQTSPELHRRIGEVRARLTDELSEMARKAANEADETGQELSFGQPLKLKHVVDMMDRMLRRRRRRLRWLRRALWLIVEWALVGLMW